MILPAERRSRNVATGRTSIEPARSGAGPSYTAYARPMIPEAPLEEISRKGRIHRSGFRIPVEHDREHGPPHLREQVGKGQAGHTRHEQCSAQELVAAADQQHSHRYARGRGKAEDDHGPHPEVHGARHRVAPA